MNQTRRSISPALEPLLGVESPVLDHGFVQVVDYMGTDADIVQAARVSYGPSTRAVREDRDLLRYLLRHRHTSPFEMCEIKFRCRMPIMVARQWIRHRTANVNEMSLRYSTPLENDDGVSMMYLPSADTIALQDPKNKQGRGGMLPPELGERAWHIMLDAAQHADRAYHELAHELGVARELARSVLPVSLYTQWVWKIDLHNLMHFLSLRLDPHAQLEIRVFAEAMAGCVKLWVPLAWEAFESYRINARTFSDVELATLGRLLDRSVLSARIDDAAIEAGLVGRERTEFDAKIRHALETADKAR